MESKNNSAIKETQNLNNLSIDELVGNLQDYEDELKEDERMEEERRNQLP